jgi:hypothetical protein
MPIPRALEPARRRVVIVGIVLRTSLRGVARAV